MRAVDTNVLVRLVARDEPKQTVAAEAFIASGAWVSCLALAEATWVLDSVYGLDAGDIATAAEMLLNHQHLTLQDADAVTQAIGQFRKHPAVGFSDCLMVELARKAGYGPLGTFDRNLGKLEGAHRI